MVDVLALFVGFLLVGGLGWVVAVLPCLRLCCFMAQVGSASHLVTVLNCKFAGNNIEISIKTFDKEKKHRGGGAFFFFVPPGGIEPSFKV